MKKSFVIISITIFFVSASPVFAAPSISGVSGTYNHGLQITITGSAFGTKSPAAPAKWDDFNDGINGNQLSTTKWPVQEAFGGSILPTYSNSVLRTNEVMSVKTVMGSGGQWSCEFGYDSPGNRYWYISYWRYDIGTTNITNYKHFRVYGNGTSELPQFAYTELATDAAIYGLWTEPNGDEPNTVWTSPIGLRNAWEREEFYVDAGTRGNSDGSAKFWRNAALLNSFSFVSPALTAGYSGQLAWPRIGHYWNAPGTMTSYFSEVYIDNTQARVEIGDASTWAACKHREIQIPSAWSSSSITFTANQGSFTNGQTAYLYVVDSTGAANSSGYQVTIGGDSPPDTTPPQAPTGVTVI